MNATLRVVVEAFLGEADMFEGHQQAALGAMEVIARRANQNLREAYEALEEWQAEADHWKAQAERLRLEVEAREERIHNLQGQLNVAAAIIHGRDAQLDEMEKLHQDSPLLQDSGLRFATGKVKKKLRLVFERTFDATLRGMGIADPEVYRSS